MRSLLTRPVAALIVSVSVALSALAAFQPTDSPVAPDGTRATVDLPAGQHVRNVGGSDGAGLCVFTSLQHAAVWQNVRSLDGFRAWMERRPGGGWPEKVDAMLAQFCREKGVAVPSYIQHTGGDDEFLALALRTDRVPCVTYSGLDDFYRDRAGRPARIAHMVNLAHLDQSRAAIIDNNRPGKWVWMTRAEFLARWRDNSGGWAVVLLAAPPPPHPPEPAQRGAVCECCKPHCKCGPQKTDDCECYPCRCWVGRGVEQGPCPNGRCGVPLAPARPSNVYAGAEPPGPAPAGYEWGPWDDGRGYGWRLKGPDLPGAAGITDFGVRSNKIHDHPEYSANGHAVTRSHAHALLSANGLADDSDHWHLTAVGDPAFLARVAADVEALPSAVRAKLHFQAYAPDHWAVPLFKLPVGVNLRGPSPARTAPSLGSLPPTDYTPAALVALLTLDGGPLWNPTAPRPAPVPVAPKQPDPVPPAQPVQPQPEPPNPWVTAGMWLLSVVAVVFLCVWRRK